MIRHIMAKRKPAEHRYLCVRVSDDIHQLWLRQAAEAGVNLSTLIRLRMSGREVVTTRKAV